MRVKNSYFLLSMGFFMILVFLSICFAEERVIFLDNALQTFLMINDKQIELMAGRFPATIARVLPYLGVKMQLSLTWIIYLFSFSYVFVQGLFVVVAQFVLRDKRWLVAIVLSLSLVMGNTFFWCNSELSQAIPFSVLAIGLTWQFYSDSRMWRAVVASFVASSILAFYHPQSLLVYLFGLLFLLPIRWKRRKGYMLPLIGLLVFFGKSHFFKNWYDTLKFEELEGNFKALYPDFFIAESWSDFLHWIPTQLLLIFGVFVVTVGVLLAKGKWYKCLLLIMGSLLNIMVFHLANTSSMTAYYAEAGYLVWSGMIAVAFSFEVLHLAKYKHYIFAVLLAMCLLKIFLVSSFYVERLEHVRMLAEKHRGEKVIINQRWLPQDLFMLNWALPFETYLTSTLIQKKNPSTVVAAESEEQYADFMAGNFFINGMGSVLQSKIDTAYFEWGQDPYHHNFKK